MANEYLAYNLINTIFYPNELFSSDENSPSKETQVLNLYGAGNTEENALDNISTSYIEFPDRITNVNGAHIYKLISSKDIDWENAFLKFSAVNEKNWGSFDKKRRWRDDTSIYVNDVYELFNVIDYLLCSCEDLWSEINKLKYKGESDVLIYFVENAASSDTLGNKIGENIFTVNDKKTYLDPYAYYTVLNIKDFGMATEIYKEGETFTLFMPEQYSNHILTGNAYPPSVQYMNTISSSKTNEGGIIVVIYGNKISDNIRLYPGSYIANFLNADNIKKPDDVIDKNNHTLKYSSVFCRDKNDPRKMHQVYVDFLLNTTKNDYDYSNYALYYLDNNNKKHIIFVSNTELISSISNEYEDILNNSIDYLISVDDELSDANRYYRVAEYDGILYPCLYVLADEFKSKLQLSTVGNDSGTIPQKSIDINIHYYKRTNDLTVTDITVDDNTIIPVKDISENNNILYSNYLGSTQGRYNVPASKQVKINYTATYIDTNSNIKLNDEYEDVMVFEGGAGINPAGEYFKYNTNQIILGSSSSDNHKRNFDQTTRIDFDTIEDNNIFHDLNKKPFKILYHKLQNPYSLSYSVTSNSLLNNNNSIIAKSLQNVIEKKEKNDGTDQYSYLQFTYSLPDGIEQVKFDLELKIKETSKVKECSVKIPFNLNKIYNPTINFISNEVNYEQLNKLSEDNTKKILSYNNGIWDRVIDPNNNTEYQVMSLKDIYINEYRFHDDGKFVDLPKVIYGNDVFEDVLTTYTTNEYSYSNTKDNGNILYMFYDDSYRSISLLGHNYVQKSLPKNSYLGYTLINNVQAYYIFNINNLSYNYTPCSGGSYYYYTAWNDSMDQRQNILNKKNQLTGTTGNVVYYDKVIYDSYANATQNINENNQTNLTYFLDIKIDNNKYVSYNNSNGEKQEYYGLDAANWVSTSSNIIHTSCFDLVKSTYTLETIESEFKGLSSEKTITTYVPITYIYMNRSTFSPNATYLPNYSDGQTTNSYYRFTFDSIGTGDTVFNDQYNYDNFIKCWDEVTPNTNNLSQYANNYNNITLHLKLRENYNSSIPPYFYESNDASLKFKILKSSYIINDGIEPSSTLTITSSIQGNILYLDYDKYYFLSDLIKINKNSLNIPIGCMPWYDAEHRIYQYATIWNYETKKTLINNIVVNGTDSSNINMGGYMLSHVNINDNNLLDGSNQKMYNVNKIKLAQGSGQLVRTLYEYEDSGLFLNQYDNAIFKLNMDYILSLITNNTGQSREKIKEVIKHLFNINDTSGFETINYTISELNSNFKYFNIALGHSSFSFMPKILSRTIKTIENSDTRLMDYPYLSTKLNAANQNNPNANYDYSDFEDYELFEYKDIDTSNSNYQGHYYEIIKDNNDIIELNDLYNIYQDVSRYPTNESRYYHQVKLFIENRICDTTAMQEIIQIINNQSSAEIGG